MNYRGKNRAGAVISQTGRQMSWNLLNQLKLSLIKDNKVVATTRQGSAFHIKVLWAGGPQAYIYVDTEHNFDSVQVEFQSKESQLSTLNVHQICVGEVPPAHTDPHSDDHDDCHEDHHHHHHHKHHHKK